MDEVGDGLGLGQVHAAVEKSSAGEFTRVGHARTALENCIQNQFGWKQAAVTGDFYGVFAGEGSGSAQDGDEDFVHVTAAMRDMTELDGVGGRGGGFQ